MSQRTLSCQELRRHAFLKLMDHLDESRWTAEPKAFLTSIKVIMSALFYSWHYSCSWQAPKISSKATLCLREEHFWEGTCWGEHGKLRGEIPPWLSHEWRLPFLLYMWMMLASLSSWGMWPWDHMFSKSSVNFMCSVGISSLKISAGSPVPLPLELCLMALRISVSVVELPNAVLILCCGRQAIHGWRPVQNCFEVFSPPDHDGKLLRRMDPSLLTIGDVPDDCGPYRVFKAS